MSNKIEKWILFKYIGLELTPVSKPFKTKEQVAKERLKCIQKTSQEDWVGVVRTPK
jgi:hypothetical protein